MINFEVRHLATSFGGAKAVAAAFTGTVSAWDIQSGEHLSTFETVLDFGGRRLAINERGDLCAAAAYSRCGLACYETGKGSLVWARADLKQLQRLSVSADGSRLYCGSEITACAVLDFETGQSLDLWRGVRCVVESRYESIVLLDQAHPVMRRVDTGASIPVTRTTFAFLDAAFGPELLCVSESGGPVRALETQSGHEVWRCEQPPGRHVLRLKYVGSERAFAAVEYSYTQPGCPRALVLLDAVTGVRLSVADLGFLAEAEFCTEGQHLLTSDGQLLSTRTGNVVRTLTFGPSAH
jgi:WD40 repeat protein